MTRARTSRGRSPHRRPDAPHGRTTHRAVPVGLVLGPEDRRASAGGARGPDHHPGGAAGQVRLHRRRRPVAGGPPGPGRLGPLVRDPPGHRPQTGPQPDRPPGGPGRRGRLRRHRDGQREAAGPLGGARPRRSRTLGRAGCRPSGARVHRRPTGRTARGDTGHRQDRLDHPVPDRRGGQRLLGRGPAPGPALAVQAGRPSRPGRSGPAARRTASACWPRRWRAPRERSSPS